MEKGIYILSHLGLGDHILCNGLYREYAKKYDHCVIPVKSRNKDTVDKMLSDLEHVEILSLSQERPDIFIYANQHNNMGYDILGLGNFGTGFLQNKSMRYDENFYIQAGVDFDKRWTEFRYPRDLSREQEIFESLVKKDTTPGKYIFLHEDASRGFIIDRSLIQSDLKVVSPSHTLGDTSDIGFFEYGYVIENAAEIHCIESAFAALIEGMNIKTKKVAHRYARPEASTSFQHEFTYKTDWEILT